jgi:hypothetical protein
VPEETPALRPLQRLRQLAKELQAALADDDMELMVQATNLLAPTLADCQTVAVGFLSASEAAEIALETRSLLNECETTLIQAMAQIHAELSRLQKGKRAVVTMRSHKTTGSGRTLDTSR